MELGDSPSGTLALGKDTAGSSPSLGPSPGRHERVLFLSLMYKSALNWEFFWVMRFNSTGKDHVRFPKKARFEDSID